MDYYLVLLNPMGFVPDFTDFDAESFGVLFDGPLPVGTTDFVYEDKAYKVEQQVYNYDKDEFYIVCRANR